jgi:hypothetical protein
MSCASAHCRRECGNGHHEIVTVCAGVAALVPQGFDAVTLIVYDPGPTVPDIVRVVVGSDPLNAPETTTVYCVTAAPVGGGFQDSVIVRPEFDTSSPEGAAGAPGQVPGNASVTGLEAVPTPALLKARTEKL